MVSLNAGSISGILKEGMPVSVRFGRDRAWTRNVVCKSAGNVIHIALTGQISSNPVEPGENILLKYVNEYFIYIFEGHLQHIHANAPEFVEIRLYGGEETINTRLSPRYDVNLEGDLTPDWENKTYPAAITDISFGGAAFTCPCRLECGEGLKISIQLPTGSIIRTDGKIVRKNLKSGYTEYSMQFYGIDEESCSKLSKYFSSLDSEISAMYRKYLTSAHG